MILQTRLGRSLYLGALALAPLLLAGKCGEDTESPIGNAGGASAGTTSASAGHAGVSAKGGASSVETCTEEKCGPQLGMPNHTCPDGSIAGPTGRCLKHANGSCGWEVRDCPADNGQGGSGGANGVGGTSQSGGAGGTSAGNSGVSGSAGANCTALRADIDAKLAAAQKCNPLSEKPGAQCAGIIDGLCCPVVVQASDPSAEANKAFTDALQKYRAACSSDCPDILCAEPKTGICKGTTADGICSPN